MNIARIETKQLFTSIREYQVPGFYRSDATCVHYCPACGQVFSAVFGWYHGMGWQKWKGDFFHCPSCGIANSTNFLSVRKEKKKDSEWLPYTLTIDLKEFKSHFVLHVSGDCIKFSTDVKSVYHDRIKETIRFDIKNKKVVFKSDMHGEIELGNPYNAQKFWDNSLLRFTTSESGIWQSYKKETVLLLKKLREEISKKTKEIHGINLTAMSIPVGHRYGLFFYQITNIAWRMACPDAQNLSLLTELEKSYCSCDVAFKNKRLSLRMPTSKDIDEIIKHTRGGLSYPQAAAKVLGLPDTKAIRKLLKLSSIFEAVRVKTGFNLMKNYNYSILIAGLLQKEDAIFDITGTGETVQQLLKFIRIIATKCGEKPAANLLINYTRLQARDSAKIYFKLTAANKKEFWRENLSVERIHNWLVNAWDNQEHPDYSLDVPAFIVKRLEMQKEQIKFFLPGSSHELRCAGRELANCVGTYADSVLKHDKYIVLVADDNGKLKVCIEVVKNKIEQAKMFANKPVSENPGLNSAVIEWALAVKLRISTDDVDIRVLPSSNQEDKQIAV